MFGLDGFLTILVNKHELKHILIASDLLNQLPIVMVQNRPVKVGEPETSR